MSDHALLAVQGAPLEKVTHRSVKDEVAERFATLIVSGVLNVGDTLPSERDLAATMGVSRETIRGALLILSTKGIVSVVQGARTKVASDDVGDLGLPSLLNRRVTEYSLDDVHEGRLMAERQVAVLAAQRTEPGMLNELEHLIDVQMAAINDPVRFLIADRAFHTAIYHACGNAVLSDLATTLYSYQLDHRRRAIAEPGAIAQSIADHRVILSALKAGDAKALAEGLGVHEQRIYDSTRAVLAETTKKATE
ncbi:MULTISPECIES: FCD domain-containing protein [Rhodobacterales]|uniref:FadR/GntR family transcriptional regulator n=1 Tax=Roseobacter sp. N2S TaxID=2663844 RepID=UPI002854745C|nr:MULTISPECIES: FCD domain-containing protein [Rhodobacterales]MDR6266975.1 DNA-binding FadR family transcriptional regulator [Roseobacter sp. N2S]